MCIRSSLTHFVISATPAQSRESPVKKSDGSEVTVKKGGQLPRKESAKESPKKIANSKMAETNRSYAIQNNLETGLKFHTMSSFVLFGCHRVIAKHHQIALLTSFSIFQKFIRDV